MTNNKETQHDIETILQEGHVEFTQTSSSPEVVELLKNPSNNFNLALLECRAVTPEVLEKIAQLRLNGAVQTPILFMTIDPENDKSQLDFPARTGAIDLPFFPSMLKQKIVEIAEAPIETEETEFAHALEGKHFLAAEDNTFNMLILEELLEHEGASAEFVDNGQLAVERMERAEPGEFDAILMDVQMPVMNGHDATRAIRKLPREDAQSILIIAMTADAFIEDQRAALAAGMNYHLTKPLDIDQLKKVLFEFEQKE